MRDFACGYDLDNPRWTTNRKSHATWCRTTSQEAVANETAQRRGEVKLCRLCRAYANAATAAAADNVKLKCGLSGARWSDKAGDHFGWCMGLREADAKPDAADHAALAAAMEKSTNPETAGRILEIEQCRLRPPASRKPSPRT